MDTVGGGGRKLSINCGGVGKFVSHGHTVWHSETTCATQITGGKFLPVKRKK